MNLTITLLTDGGHTIVWTLPAAEAVAVFDDWQDESVEWLADETFSDGNPNFPDPGEHVVQVRKSSIVSFRMDAPA